MAGEFAIVYVILSFLVLQQGNCAKILIIPIHHRSHINIFRNLGQALSENGHKVIVLAAEKWSKQLEGYTFEQLTFSLPREADPNVPFERAMLEDPTGKMVFATAMANPWPEPGRHCDTVLANQALMKRIKEERFNLAIMDGPLGLQCMYTIPYKFDIPYITFHGIFTTSWAAGVTGLPSIEPDTLLAISNRMTFWEQFINLQSWLRMMDDDVFNKIRDQRFLQIYVPEKPLKKFSDIMKDSEMFLLNYEVTCLDYPRVSAPNYQYLGPSSLVPVLPLPNYLEEFVQGAEHGVVIMSLGSFKAWQYTWLVIRDKMFTAFGKLQRRVLVQYDMDDDFNDIPENVLKLKWLSQNDLLAHPKTKLFVTHGGNNGQNEAVYHGVPMLVIPILLDHPYAGVRAIARGYGNYVKDKETVTSEELLSMMQEILSNDSYSENVKRCSRIIKSLPTAPERFVFWVNHVLEFGGKHLRPPSLDMPLYQLLMLDIVALYVGIGLVVIHVMLALIYFICTYAFCAGKPKKD